MTQKPKKNIAVAATFTAEPLEETLRFWGKTLSLSGGVEFAPYNQVLPQLLDPSSVLSRNHGINLVLLRFSDWLRFRQAEERAIDRGRGAEAQTLEGATRELVSALKGAAARSPTPTLVCLCPDSNEAMADSTWVELIAQREAILRVELGGIGNVFLLTRSEIDRHYPVREFYDSYRDELGHVPFTPLYFAALGTAIVRKMHALDRPPFKVVVLDCDETLWRGVLGEDGVAGIVIDPPRKALQDFVIAQHEAGMLVCLCSRNREEDVDAVFAQRREMSLRREHIVSWRLNWGSKSESLRSLAEELSLGLDSFVFFDDDPVVCAEVRANAPEVLTLQLPEEPERIPHFLAHLWAFDRLKLTAEDSRRTALYRDDLERQRWQRAAPSFQEFLGGLALEVDVAPLTPETLARVSQLTQRTNQFHLATVRRTEAEISNLLASGWECLTVHVRDRFGDYGLVGVLLFHAVADGVQAGTFLLSCRALGRGVEHRMLAALGKIAEARGLSFVDLPYVPSARNQPALEFLEANLGDFREETGGSIRFRVPAAAASGLRHAPPGADLSPRRATEGVASAPSPSGPAPSEVFRRIAIELSTPEQVLRTLRSDKRRRRPTLASAFVEPATPTERRLAPLWVDLLGVEPAGARDSFFELGGHSLSATLLLARAREILGAEISLADFFQAPTLEALAQHVDRWHVERSESADLEGLLAELEGLSDEQVEAELSRASGRPSPGERPS